MPIDTSLTAFFKPRSVAIVGASRNPGKLGYLLLKNLQVSGYRGKIWPINPEAKRILNTKVYASMADLPGVPDLVVVAVPAPIVDQVVTSAGELGVKAMIIISAGFSESDDVGKAREQSLAALAARYHIRIIGPNCLGIMSPINRLNLTFSATGDMPSRGALAFVSQSGALGTAWLDSCVRQPLLGLSHFISLGNKVDVDEADLLEELATDGHTKAILIYCEGLKNGQRFTEVARRVGRKVPIVMLKSGVSSQAQAAIASHTGSLAGSAQAYRTALSGAGVLMVKSLQELSDVGQILAHQPVLMGKRLAIITNAGGPGILATDSVIAQGLEVAQLYQITERRLRAELPGSAAVKNPIDILGDALSDRYQHALYTIAKDRNIDGVLVILTPQAMTEINQSAEVIGRFAADFDKPVVASFMGEFRVKAGRDVLSQHGVPNFGSPEDAVRALKASYEYGQLRRRPTQSPQTLPPAPPAAQHLIQTAVGAHQTRLSTFDSLQLLKAYRIPVVESVPVLSTAAALRELPKLGTPVVIKVDEPEIVHKSDVHGVKINLSSPANIINAMRELNDQLRPHVSHHQPLNFLMQAQAPAGIELLIGFQRDAQFGPLMTVGLGGIYVEIFKDVSFGLAPLNPEQAIELLSQIQAFPLLRGARGKAGVDLKEVARIISRVSHLALHHHTIREFEINPLIARPDGVIAVDARTILFGS